MSGKEFFKERGEKVQVDDESEYDDSEHSCNKAMKYNLLTKIDFYLRHSSFENKELGNVHKELDGVLKGLTDKYKKINDKIVELDKGENFNKLPFQNVKQINFSLKGAEYMLQNLFDGLFLSFRKGFIDINVVIDLCENALPIFNGIKIYNEKIYDVFSQRLRDFISNSREENFNALDLELQEEMNTENEGYDEDGNGCIEFDSTSKRVRRLQKLEKIHQKFLSRFKDVKMRRKRLHDISIITKYVLNVKEGLLNDSTAKKRSVKDEEMNSNETTTEKARKRANIFRIFRIIIFILIIISVIIATVIFQIKKN